MEIKRVACLYRVSTKKQVDKLTDDIPMQKNACSEFIKSKEKDGWKLIKEYAEKGVSGYKKKSVQRDVLQQIKADAEKQQFDILLVFMFDRLGRREDETPFIVEWFDSIGIEVWSVKEGQQMFENRADKLMNYIRFWQSGGESEKTGIRVKEKHEQMIENGLFTGGLPPYGYKLIESGQVSRTGRLLKKLAVDEKEREIVELVYSLAAEKGFGGVRIAKYMNDLQVPTRKNSKWGLTVVNYMLRNPIYKGYPAYGKTSAVTGSNKRIRTEDWKISKVRVNELAIISEETWEKVQKIRNERTPDTHKNGNIPKSTKGELLLSGLIRCGACGSTMCTYHDIKNSRSGKKDTVYYRCTNANRGIRCDGQKMYKKEKIESPVIDEIHVYLDTLERMDISQKINSILKNNISKEEKKLAGYRSKLSALESDAVKLNSEIVKSLSDDSFFSAEQLSAAIVQNSEQQTEIKERIGYSQKAIELKSKDFDKIVNLKEIIPEWKAEFDKAPNETKKILIYELIEYVTVIRDRIDIKFRINFDDFVYKFVDNNIEIMIK